MAAATRRILCLATCLVLALTASAQGGCSGQSCLLASFSGSSGVEYTSSTLPSLPDKNKTCCIAHYNPAVAELLYSQVPGLEASCPTAKILQPSAAPKVTSCPPKVLIFAAGTSDLTQGGGWLGSAMQRSLNDTAGAGKWLVVGVPYANTNEGYNCLGLHGSVTGKRMLRAYLRACPDTGIYMAGYSQGAMVAREAVASWASSKYISATLTFGDPFNGAPIKDYRGPLKVICANGDYVCSGIPRVEQPHVSYGSNATAAAEWLEKLPVVPHPVVCRAGQPCPCKKLGTCTDDDISRRGLDSESEGVDSLERRSLLDDVLEEYELTIMAGQPRPL